MKTPKWIAGVATVGLLAMAAPVLAAPSASLKGHLAFTGEAAGDQAGFQVEIADLDGDRIGDLVVGAWKNDAGGDASGAVYIEYGPITKGMSLGKADVKLFTSAPGEYVGEGPLGIADLDGDKAQELVIGAPGSHFVTQPGSPGKVGEAFLLYGGKRLRGDLSLHKVADVRFTGVHMTEWLGFGSSGVGDLDGDGLEEMLIGAPASAGFSGLAYLFYGSKKRLTGDVPVRDADAIFAGGRAGDMFGYEAAGGDVDDDGDNDLFVASRPHSGGPAAISMFQGGTRMTGVVPAATAFTTFPVTTVDIFVGAALASGSDVTGDGVDDLVAGVDPSWNPFDDQTTYVFGGSNDAFARGVSVESFTEIGGTGSAVAVGDVNGDRKADVAAGAEYTGGGTAYLFYGPLPEGELALDQADAIFEGEPDSSAGAALAIGSLDKDRRGDLAVGAPANAGRTYVVLGRRIR